MAPEVRSSAGMADGHALLCCRTSPGSRGPVITAWACKVSGLYPQGGPVRIIACRHHAPCRQRYPAARRPPCWWSRPSARRFGARWAGGPHRLVVVQRPSTQTVELDRLCPRIGGGSAPSTSGSTRRLHRPFPQTVQTPATHEVDAVLSPGPPPSARAATPVGPGVGADGVVSPGGVVPPGAVVPAGAAVSVRWAVGAGPGKRVALAGEADVAGSLTGPQPAAATSRTRTPGTTWRSLVLTGRAGSGVRARYDGSQ